MVTLYNPRKFGVPFPFTVSQLLMLHYRTPQTKLSDNHPCIMFTDPQGQEFGKVTVGRTVSAPCCLGPLLGRLEGRADLTARN